MIDVNYEFASLGPFSHALVTSDYSGNNPDPKLRLPSNMNPWYAGYYDMPSKKDTRLR